MHLFMLNKYLSSSFIVYCTSDTVVGVEYITQNEADKVPDLMVLAAWLEKTNNNHNKKIISTNKAIEREECDSIKH